MRRSARALALALGLAALALPGVDAAARDPIGVFATADDLARARRRLDAETRRPDRRAAFAKEVAAARARPADPFVHDGPETMRFGHAERRLQPPDDTIPEMETKLRRDTDAMRTLALSAALEGDPRDRAAALRLMRRWAREHTVVNVYDYDPDFVAARIAGMTEGFHSARPWNFALAVMWQTYGLINASDAYLLLSRTGPGLNAADRAALSDWIRRLAEGVNSSLHAWTRWADGSEARRRAAGETAPVARRYRADNHVSWALAGLLAAAAALDDRALADYALHGAEWRDRRAGRQANSTPLLRLLDLAIEAGPEPETAGRIYEERLPRDPPVGYALFHLQALALAARIAEIHFATDLWRFRGADGAGLLDSFGRYRAYLAGDRTSPDPDERMGQPWLFALSPPGFGGPERAALLAAKPLPAHLSHAIGPVDLLFGAAR